MKCDIAICDEDAYMLVWFQHSESPYPYCLKHSTRWDKSSGRWKKALAWRKGVTRTQPIT